MIRAKLSKKKTIFDAKLRFTLLASLRSAIFRCYAGAEDEMIRCYVEDCPTDVCSKTCGAPLKQDMQVCDQLYAETGMTEIGYTLCINKVFVSFQLKFVFL